MPQDQRLSKNCINGYKVAPDALGFFVLDFMRESLGGYDKLRERLGVSWG